MTGIRDIFNFKFTKDLTILGRISKRRALIRCAMLSSTKGGEPYRYEYAVAFCDGQGWPQTDEGIILSADELLELAEMLNKLAKAGEIRNGCDKAEFDANVAKRAEFERKYSDAHRRCI